MNCPTMIASDSHIGAEGGMKCKDFLGLVAERNPGRLILNGDIGDLWVDPEGGRKKLWKTLNLLKCPWVHIPGNHDDVEGTGPVFSWIRTRTGKRYAVTHGAQFDRWMEYRTLGIVLSRLHNWVMRKNWSLADYLMHKAERGAGDLAAFEKAACRAAIGFDGIICGHTHVAAQKVGKGVEYWNCGAFKGAHPTWIEEDSDGELHVCGS